MIAALVVVFLAGVWLGLVVGERLAARRQQIGGYGYRIVQRDEVRRLRSW